MPKHSELSSTLQHYVTKINKKFPDLTFITLPKTCKSTVVMKCGKCSQSSEYNMRELLDVDGIHYGCSKCGQLDKCEQTDNSVKVRGMEVIDLLSDDQIMVILTVIKETNLTTKEISTLFNIEPLVIQYIKNHYNVERKIVKK